ncbi:unnamed protein product [Hydatigera taeniaeformis]|uniref:LysR_substrate domain-containing protein n=1 Tax=Hydatigena taeniaeformis TaxID=6205 RepID=A0A0R3WZM9_HYDTA|nr:unnamed protein product [Hydatigera taeniaeformis]
MCNRFTYMSRIAWLVKRSEIIGVLPSTSLQDLRPGTKLRMAREAEKDLIVATSTCARTRVDAVANVLRTFKVTNSLQPISVALGSLIDACVSPAHAWPSLESGL